MKIFCVDFFVFKIFNIKLINNFLKKGLPQKEKCFFIKKIVNSYLKSNKLFNDNKLYLLNLSTFNLDNIFIIKI